MSGLFSWLCNIAMLSLKVKRNFNNGAVHFSENDSTPASVILGLAPSFNWGVMKIINQPHKILSNGFNRLTLYSAWTAWKGCPTCVEFYPGHTALRCDPGLGFAPI